MSEPTRSRILIVDDEEAILETMSFTFMDDYNVLTTSDPTKAMGLIEENTPIAVVITDQRMPGHWLLFSVLKSRTIASWTVLTIPIS